MSNFGKYRSVEGIWSATIVGAAVGLSILGLMLLAGWGLSHRLWPESLAAMVGFLLVFGIIGAYLGWLVGIVTFSALLGSKPPIQGGPSEEQEE